MRLEWEFSHRFNENHYDRPTGNDRLVGRLRRTSLELAVECGVTCAVRRHPMYLNIINNNE